MKRLIIFIFLLAAGISSPQAIVAQQRHPAGQQQKKKSATQRKKPSQAKKASPAAQSSATFEGSLLYRQYEYHSGVVRQFSHGMAYNGERTVMVTVKGQAVHIADASMHIHTIIQPKEKTVYVYSDVTQTGLRASYDEYLPYMGTLDPTVSLGEGLEKKSNLSATKDRVSYEGDDCRVFKGQLTTGPASQTDVEMWYTDRFKVPACLKYAFAGLPVPGIVRRGLYNQNGSAGILGSMKSMVATELIALSRYSVSAAEMLPPQGCSIEPFSNDRLNALLKANKSQLKKQKLYPQIKKKKEVKYELRQRWDFASEWLEKDFPEGREYQRVMWAKVGESLFDLAGAISGRAVAPSTASDSADDDNEDDDENEVNPPTDDSGKSNLYRIYLKRYNKYAGIVKSNVESYEDEKDRHIRKKMYFKVSHFITRYQLKMKNLRRKAEKYTGQTIERSKWERKKINIPPA